jgi:NAD(P)-dependent dehydrogenase (short-subunit alcohol dehydrogenase family)
MARKRPNLLPILVDDLRFDEFGAGGHPYVTVDRDVSQVSDDVLTTLVRNIPWRRAGTPADIAHAALFLASPEADFITGEVLSVDGGSGTGRTYLPYSRTT